ncbi:MAG: TauD/TfdA family dioxygenase [Kiloniellales bacterium]|nr:TauD/TfdA family dioxygenase [Kiloniellales bacterium]
MASPSFTVEPVTPVIGAEVHGLDLARPLDAETRAQLHDAWITHLVLFFRDQALSKEALRDFAAGFGQLHVHPMGDVPDHPGIIEVRTDAKSKTYAGHLWHSDVSCDAEPPAGSILYLQQVPATGGDTLFANMYAAYEALSAPLRAFLDGLSALHSGRMSYRDYFGMAAEEMRDGVYPEAVHPVVATHPVSGRKCLFVNENFTHHIEGLEPEESRAVLDLLYRHIAQPRFQCRFRWRANSVAMWDNRCTQHLAMWDYYPETRAGYRATITAA